jgi:hypothetical protein
LISTMRPALWSVCSGIRVMWRTALGRPAQ